MQQIGRIKVAKAVPFFEAAREAAKITDIRRRELGLDRSFKKGW